MKQALLLVSWAGTIHLAKQMLESSLAGYSRPIVVVINEIEKVTDTETLDWLMANQQVIPIDGNRWEVGGLEAIFIFTDYDEWILIQDTLEIKNPIVFDVMFDHHPGRSVSFGPGWLCYLGKYRRQIIGQFPLPVCLNKMDAFYYEHVLPMMYESVSIPIEGRKPYIMFPEWGNSNPKNTRDFKFDRENMVLDNPYIIKRKSVEWQGPFNIKAAIQHR